MAKDFGTDVSRVMDPEDIGHQLVVWQRNNPPTDAELNLLGQLNNEERQKAIRSLMPSGWIASPSKSTLDFYSHVSFSNYFYMGRQLEQETTDETEETNDIRNIAYANVNGWVIPVTGTKVNQLTSLNDNDFRNKIVLPFGPTSGFEMNFVFLEVWQALIAPTPSTDNKPTGDTIYKWGNVEYGGTNPTEDLIASDIGAETTKRIQLQYRIRIVDSVDFITHPLGFTDTANVYARAGLTQGEADDLAGTSDTTFAPMPGDEGLWRAGDGDPDNGIGSVDGYTYAISICNVPRRNRGGYSLSTINGAVSRRSPPTGYVEGTPDSGCPIDPGDLATAPASDRPDGKYSDLVLTSDVTDMRHMVSPVGHSYEEILEEAYNDLLNQGLPISPKMSTVGGTQYSKILLYTDEITAGADNPSTITIGEPDGVRRIFSDAALPQGKNFEAVSAASKSPSSPSYGTNPSNWMPKDILEVDHPTSLNTVDDPSVFLTNDFELTYRGGKTPIVTGFVTSATASTVVSTGAFTEYSADADQFQGYGIRIIEGAGSGEIKTINTIDSDDQVTIFGSWSATPDSTSTFAIFLPIIVASATTDSNFLTITIVSINGDVDFTSTDISSANLTDDMWVDYTLHYPAGQGLSLRPDNIYQVNYTNPTSTVLLPPASGTSTNLLVPRYINHSPDFINPALKESSYFGQRTTQASCYVDSGSETVVVQPWQLVTPELQPRKMQAFIPDHNYYGLFETEFSLEVPPAYLPTLGGNAIPIIEASAGVFYTGLHVWAYNETDAEAEVVINLMGRSDFDEDDFVGLTVFARQDDIVYEAEDSGSPDKIGCRINPSVGGIQLPTYIGLARVIGVFEKADFDTNGIDGTNLLNFHANAGEVGATVWVGRTDDHTDVTFTLLPGAITDYAEATEYVIVANTFGYREGFITENSLITAHEQVVGIDETVTLHLVVPQALPGSAVVQITYDRTPYQGSIYNRAEPFADTTPEPFDNRGLVSSTDLALLDADLDVPSEQGTIFHYEVLATKEFVTTLGSGRFSGIGTGRFYDKANISNGFPDGRPRWEELRLSDIHVDRAGFTARLPLGARYRDADFVGEDIITGQDKGPHINFSGEVNPPNLIYSEDTESAPLGAGQIITVTEGNHGAPSDTTQYRTTRGGSGYLQESGGPLIGGSKNVRLGFKALHGIAVLVRNFDENGPENFDLPWDSVTNPNVLKGRGGELQMVILTGAAEPIYDVQAVYADQVMNTVSAPSGVGEGFSAVDRYRVSGRPLEHQPLLAPYSELTTVSQAFDDRVPIPRINSVFPDRAVAGDSITVRGTGLSVMSSAQTGRGVEIFARRQDVVSDLPLVPLTAEVTDTGEDHIIFRVSDALTVGRYDIVVRSGDGQIDISFGSLTLDPTSSNLRTIPFTQNFTSFENGSLPPTVSANSTGSLRVSDVDARIGHQCAFFRGTGQAGSDIVRIPTTTPALAFGTSFISHRFSVKMMTTPLDTGNTLDIVYQAVDGTTFDNVFGLTLTAASSFFTFTIYDELLGTGDLVVPSTVLLDTDWHDVELQVTSGLVVTLYIDGEEVTSVTASGTSTIFAGSYVPGRMVLDNTATAALTIAQVLLDRVTVQNYAAGTALS